MSFNRQEINKDNILSTETFRKLLDIQYYDDRLKAEEEVEKIAEELKMKTQFKKDYDNFKKLYLGDERKIYFGKDAPCPTMISAGYSIDKEGNIYDYRGVKICSQLVEPVAIYENIETDKEIIKCAFKKDDKWKTFTTERINLFHNGKIVSLTQKGLDVSTANANLLVKYFQDIINANRKDLHKSKSISRLGWYGDDFIPYDGDIEYDGDDNFRNSFLAVTSKGDYDKWLAEMYNVRKNKIVRILHATSLASVLLGRFKKLPFVTMLWGKTGDGKTVAAMTAMSIWGNPSKGNLMFTLNNTNNFYFRTANFFYNLPVYFDELESYNGDGKDISKLIMNICEGIDRGKAKADGGIEKNKTWNNAFIMTGEHTASNYNSAGGALNRLIEINSNGKIIQNGHKTVSIITENYGFAGKKFIEYIKNIGKEELEELYNQKFQELMKVANTEEKQALNMAIVLLADTLACMCIFTDDSPLTVNDVKDYMFTKDEIDTSQRAYEKILEIVLFNKSRFTINKNDGTDKQPGGYVGVGEYWGQIDEYTIKINKYILENVLSKNGFSFKKTMRDWAQKGYIETSTSGKNYTCTSSNGVKSYYVVINVKENYRKEFII